MKTLARRADKTDILRRMKTVRVDSPGRWGRMSSHQMICHLTDSFRVVMGQKPVSHTRTLLERTVVKWFALYAPLPWPKGIPTRPEVDQFGGGTQPAEFAADVAELEALIDVITVEGTRVEWTPHPIFGAMSDAAWLRWAYLHMDHHLRQFGA